jgi:RNA polymerase sigma-70 factor (ECF subfamily)
VLKISAISGKLAKVFFGSRGTHWSRESSNAQHPFYQEITMHTAPAVAAASSPDTELARRVVAGDHAAFAELMRRYNRLLYRTARAILKDDAEAEDALQDAYLLAFRAIANFRGEAKLSTWFVRIVANEALGRLRKRARAAEVTYLDETARDEPERAALRTEVMRLLESKIDRLPDAFRTVFMLRALEEMSVEETAAALDIPEATVRSRYFRAKGLVREALASEIDAAFEDAFGFAGARCDRMVASVMARIAAL